MSEDGFKIRDQNAIHFLTFSVVQYVDVFTKEIYKDILVESLKYCQANKGLLIKGYIFMPNHIHLIVAAKEGFQLSNILRDFKKFTSRAIIKTIEASEIESRKSWMLWLFKKAGENNDRNTINQFWQQGNHPIECYTSEIFKSRLDYLHYNPVKAGLVWNPEDYKYSSAIDYLTNRKGLIEIDL